MSCTAAQPSSFGSGGSSGGGEPAAIDRDVPEIVAGQAASLRVATLVARGARQDELFAIVNQDLAQLVRADAAALLRFEPDQTITLLAALNAAGAPVPAGEREPATAALCWLRDTSRSLRFGAAGAPLTGPFIAQIWRLGIRAAVAVPIQVDGRVWGISMAASRSPKPFPQPPKPGWPSSPTCWPPRSPASTAAPSWWPRTHVPSPPPTRAARQIQRDPHDGAQQRLITTIFNLKLAAAMLRQTGHPAAEVVTNALESAEHADADLRELVRGIMPTPLGHGGLRAAVRHGVVELEIRDDGAGGAGPRYGTGLTSPPGMGTTIAVQLPTR